MTHSLHRQGSVESLQEDYVVLIFDNVRGRLPGPKALLQGKFPHAYATIKGILSKLGIVKSKKEFPKTVVLNSRDELLNYVKKLKEANTGKSVVVSGLIDEVNSCLKELALFSHTIQFSLGCFGKTDKLPSKEVLEVTTMCGHHLVAPKFVELMASDVDKGVMTKKEAAEAMGRLCVCGIFNEPRAVKIIDAVKNN